MKKLWPLLFLLLLAQTSVPTPHFAPYYTPGSKQPMPQSTVIAPVNPNSLGPVIPYPYIGETLPKTKIGPQPRSTGDTGLLHPPIQAPIR